VNTSVAGVRRRADRESVILRTTAVNEKGEGEVRVDALADDDCDICNEKSKSERNRRRLTIIRDRGLAAVPTAPAAVLEMPEAGNTWRANEM
jgi:hypothetical protein